MRALVDNPMFGYNWPMPRFNSYDDAERALLFHLHHEGRQVAGTREVQNVGFCLLMPHMNRNTHSDYEYAQLFWEWLVSGERALSDDLIAKKPFVRKFLDTAGLPDNFNSSYGWKIRRQLVPVIDELQRNPDTRRATMLILWPQDHVILGADTTHEYPCTVAVTFQRRRGSLDCSVMMRSNNVWGVMPYDVFNFTNLQMHVADALDIPLGSYYHYAASMHYFLRDEEAIALHNDKAL